MRAAKLDSASGLRLGILNGLLVIGASFFVHREIWRHLDLWPLLFDNWAENCLFACSIIYGWMTGAFSAGQLDSRMKTAYKWAMDWGVPAFLFFYVAAAALCERLNFAVWDHFLLRGTGVALVLIGLGVRVWAHATVPPLLRAGATKSGADPAAVTGQQPAITEQASRNDELPEQTADASIVPTADEIKPTGPYKWVRHPDRAGRILFLIGVPLCFGAWMPLFALPGALVLLNWHLGDLEAYCVSQLGDSYLRYKEHTKRLLPRLF